MINFHKFNFLDCKKLKTFLDEKNLYLYEYNPYWIFTNASFYKPEICFGNEYVFIRYNLPGTGKVYYPPIKNQGGNLEMTLLEMAEDANELEIPFYLGPIPEGDRRLYESLSYSVLKNDNLSTYIFNMSELSNLALNKNYKNDIKTFNKMHKDVFLKKVKKEDFTQIIEFISTIRDKQDELEFYPKINELKECMDHLYELDLIGVLLLDEKQTYGFAVGSLMDNCFYYHLMFYDSEVVGALPMLISALAKYAQAFSRFAAMPAHKGKKELIDLYESLKPLRIENYNGNFNV